MSQVSFEIINQINEFVLDNLGTRLIGVLDISTWEGCLVYLVEYEYEYYREGRYFGLRTEEKWIVLPEYHICPIWGGECRHPQGICSPEQIEEIEESDTSGCAWL